MSSLWNFERNDIVPRVVSIFTKRNALCNKMSVSFKMDIWILRNSCDVVCKNSGVHWSTVFSISYFSSFFINAIFLINLGMFFREKDTFLGGFKKSIVKIIFSIALWNKGVGSRLIQIFSLCAKFKILFTTKCTQPEQSRTWTQLQF